MDILQRQEALFNDTVQGYQKDRIVRQQEFDMKDRDFDEQIAVLENRLSEKKHLNHKLTTEYFQYRNATVEDAKRLEDALEVAKVERATLEAQLEKSLTAQEQNCQYNDTLYSQKTR